jgi:hypothetical protein
LTLPVNVTPPTWRPFAGADAADPTAAVKPCEFIQLAKAAASRVVELAVLVTVVAGDVARCATDGDFEPPQLAATSARHVSAPANKERRAFELNICPKKSTRL